MNLRTELEDAVRAYKAQAQTFESYASSTRKTEEREKFQLLADMVNGFTSDMEYLLSKTTLIPETRHDN